ncbi:MAG: hypothetical protein MZV49_00075 [Rhodopseudomonas palustris]|nr:hypothetical protein [Rhodopseudomonas palustris]
MVFVNYIAGMKAIPFLRHAAADQDVFTLTDVVFPGFLFIVGVSIPLALARMSGPPGQGRPGPSSAHVLVRTAGPALPRRAARQRGPLLGGGARASAGTSGISWPTLAVFALWAVRRRGRDLPQGASVSVLKIGRGDPPRRSGRRFPRPRPGRPGDLAPDLVVGHPGHDRLVLPRRLACSSWPAAATGRSWPARSAVAAALYVGGRHGALDLPGPGKRVPQRRQPVRLARGRRRGRHAGRDDLPRRVTASPPARPRPFPGRPGRGAPRRRLRPPARSTASARSTAPSRTAWPRPGSATLVFLLFYVCPGRPSKEGKAAAFLLPAGRNPLLAYLLPGLIGNAAALVGGSSSASTSDGSCGRWRPPAASAGMVNAAVMTGLVLLLTAALTRAGLVLKL